jgi:hypothetical protein
MKKRINKGIQTKVKRLYSYSAEERKAVKDLFWPYLKSKTVAELKVNQKVVLDKLHPCNKV